MHIDPSKKSDVGHLRLESPTSDNAENQLEAKSIRVVPLRDLARYAGRLIRASVAEDSDLLVTDRGHPLVLITPLTDGAPVPRYRWSNEGLVQRSSKESRPEIPEHLTGDERAIAELLSSQPMSVDRASRALGWSVGRTSVSLVRLELQKIAHRRGASWRLCD